MALATNPCVHNCGVMVESQYFLDGGAPLPPPNPRYRQPNEESGPHEPHSHAGALDEDEDGRVLVYTDGIACNADDHRRRRVA